MRVIKQSNPSGKNANDNANDFWFFVHDVDKFAETDSKDGNVKVISVENDEYKNGQIITSVDFNVSPVVPINGMDIYDETHWFMTIGGRGVGYVSLASLNNKNN